jgi:GT2 family glycosyltransferase
MPDLSVTVACMRDGTVRRTVASLIASARAAAIDTEILVIWQGNGPPPVLPGAEVVPIHNVNLSYARNRGAQRSAAPLVGFVDDDELVDLGWVPAAVRALADADGAFGPIDALDADGRPHCETGHGEERVYEGYIAPWLVGTGGSMAFRADALRAHGGFDLRFGAGSVGMSAEETELIWRLMSDGRRIRWAPDMVVYHPTKTAAKRPLCSTDRQLRPRRRPRQRPRAAPRRRPGPS